MDKTPNQPRPIKPASPHSTRHHLPQFPDEETSTKWIWPPFAGRNILNKVFKYALRARLQQNDTWMINAKNHWRCYSKSDWLFRSEAAAREAIRANINIHLECSPILSEQRCVAVASDINEAWRLWQIVGVEPTLAEDLVKALQQPQFEQQALESFRCATRYADALQQSISYPPLLNLTPENLGISAERQLVYLGPIDKENAIQATTEEAIVEIIKPAFTELIIQTWPDFDNTEIVKELDKIDGFEQQYLIDMLTQLFQELSHE